MTQEYIIKDYQKGYEKEQARIGREVSRNWIWPYAYDLEDLLEIHAHPNFDPDTRHYCFSGDEMVGFMFSVITPSQNDDPLTATLAFPRLLPGHEQAAELMIEMALIRLREKGVDRVLGRVTTMCPGTIKLAEKMGFSFRDWGYKVYYNYDMAWEKLDHSDITAREIDPEKDLEECAQHAAIWYKRPSEWCCQHLADWHQHGIITHLGVWQQGELVASCLTAANSIRPSTAANYYIFAPDEKNLKALLAKVVEKCIDSGVHNIIADLVNEHRQFEPIYQKLGFRKAVDWAHCEKQILR